ncbi:unnamed protein product [Symbiodinium sp. KB8]|nr:unnamed protein product [Symbiodinium sp. KB8]
MERQHLGANSEAALPPHAGCKAGLRPARTFSTSDGDLHEVPPPRTAGPAHAAGEAPTAPRLTRSRTTAAVPDLARREPQGGPRLGPPEPHGSGAPAGLLRTLLLAR